MTISIIIPVYNTEAYLEKCLDSVFAQTFQDFEVIVVNDGSPDGSQAIIDRYCARYPDKMVALYQENAGQAAARNHGLQVAKGVYIDFLDSDDSLHPEALHTAYTEAIRKQLDIVCYRSFREENGEIQELPNQCFGCTDPVREYILTEAVPWNKLIRRELLTQNNLCFSCGRIYEDFELIPRLALYTDKIGFIEDRLYYYLIRSGSTMQQTKYSPKLTSIFPVMETLRSAFQNSPYLPELECLYIVHFLHDAALRFLPYAEGRESVLQIVRIMKEHFPRWQKNKYYQGYSLKFKIVCMLIYYKQFGLLKLLLKG